MRGYIGPDETLTLTAPAGGVVRDVPVQIGEIVVVPIVNATAGTAFAGRSRGVVELPKTNVAMTEGQAVGWSRTNGNVVVATPDFPVGLVVRAAVASETRVRVVLRGA